MPVLSLHNTYSLPSGSASYTLGLSGAPNVSSYSYPTSVGASTLDRTLLGTGIGGTAGVVSHLIGGGVGASSGFTGLTSTNINPLSTNLGFNTNAAYSTYTNPLLTSGAMNIKLKPYDDLDLIAGGRYGPRAVTPSSPIPSANWGLDSYSGIDGVNPAFMHVQRPHSRLGALDLDGKKTKKISSKFSSGNSSLVHYLCELYPYPE